MYPSSLGSGGQPNRLMICSALIRKYEQYLRDTDKVVTILYWTQRQQAWSVEEAQATSVVFQNITEWEKDTGFDFHLNTGDISQNANRSFEWRYHYKYADDLIRTMPHMITCG
jgi:hypothetical protein